MLKLEGNRLWQWDDAVSWQWHRGTAAGRPKPGRAHRLPEISRQDLLGLMAAISVCVAVWIWG